MFIIFVCRTREISLRTNNLYDIHIVITHLLVLVILLPTIMWHDLELCVVLPYDMLPYCMASCSLLPSIMVPYGVVPYIVV